MSKLEDKALEAIERFEKLAETHSDEFIEFSLTMARVDILANLIPAGLVFIASSIGIFIAYWLIQKGNRLYNEATGIAGEGYRVGGAWVAGFSVPCMVVALIHLLNIWYWVGLVNPEIWIAKELLNL